MNDSNEVCAGQEGCSSKVVFACNCGNPVVFLCQSCAMNHLIQPRLHLFLPLVQARELLKESDFSETCEEFYGKHLEIKRYIRKYIKNLEDFKVRILNFKQQIIEEIEAVVQSNLSKIDELIDHTHFKLKDFDNRTADLSQVDLNIFTKYENESIKSLVDKYASELNLNEHEIKRAIHQMITIQIEYVEEVKQPENNPDPKPDFNPKPLPQIEQVIQDFTIKDYSRNFEVQQIKKELEEVKLNNPNIDSSSYIFYPKNSTKELVEYDADLDAVTSYDLSNHITHNFQYSTSCILPNGNIIIAGGCSGFYLGDTYKIDVSKNPVQSTKLGNLNTPRRCAKVIYYEGYIYIFGGSDTKKAERMKVNESDWTSLPDMIEARMDMGVYVEGSRIYIIGGQGNTSIEYYDIQLNTFTLLPNIQVPIRGAVAGVIEDKIYVIGYNHLRVFSKDFQLLESKDSINNYPPYSLSNIIIKDSKLIYVRHGDSSLNIFDAVTKTKTILKIL